MPAVAPPGTALRRGRHRRPRRASHRRPATGAAGILLTLVVMLLTGCQGLGAAADVSDRSDLVNNLAGQLDRAAELTYSADYQLSGGARATIVQAQRPRRSAYTFPGGRLTVTAQATTRCSTGSKVVCQVTAPPTPDDRPVDPLAGGTSRPAMVTPAQVAALLRASALDTDATVEQHDTTVAGHHASCVGIRPAVGTGATGFVACVTADGVLGSFEGEVGRQPVEVALTRYRDTVDPGAFQPPPGAAVVDRRAR